MWHSTYKSTPVMKENAPVCSKTLAHGLKELMQSFSRALLKYDVSSGTHKKVTRIASLAKLFHVLTPKQI